MSLKTLSLILCTFIYAPVFSENIQTNSAKKPKIAIIGAGISGLTAAYRLNQHGFNVDVFEARERVGGRIFTVKINDSVCEMGGHSLSDGDDAPCLNKLVKEFELETTRLTMPLAFHYFDGKEHISPNDQRLRLDEECQSLKSKIDATLPSSTTIKDIMDEILSEKKDLYSLIKTRIEAYEGGRIEEQSSKNSDTLFHLLNGGLSSVHTDTYDLYSLKEGNSQLPLKLASKLGEKVHLNMPLVKVRQHDEKYELFFENGETYLADILILSIPCPVYKDIDFTNTLSDEFLQKIDSIKYGQNSKLVIPIQKCEIEKTASKNWCLYKPNETQLTLYFTKEASHYHSQNLNQKYFQEATHLNLIFPQLIMSSSCACYIDETPLKNYSEAVGYSWPEEKYSQGSYSFFSVGADELFLKREQIDGSIYRSLFKPMNDTLFFIGEHAGIDDEIIGTMETACESGERISQAIIRKLSLSL